MADVLFPSSVVTKAAPKNAAFVEPLDQEIGTQWSKLVDLTSKSLFVLYRKHPSNSVYHYDCTNGSLKVSGKAKAKVLTEKLRAEEKLTDSQELVFKSRESKDGNVMGAAFWVRECVVKGKKKAAKKAAAEELPESAPEVSPEPTGETTATVAE